MVGHTSPNGGEDLLGNSGGYMANAFKDLHVEREIQDLFRYIEDYKPVPLDLEDSHCICRSGIPLRVANLS